MRHTTARLVIAAALLVAAAHAARAQADERAQWANGLTEPLTFESHRYTAEQASAARARWEQIGGAARGAAWAGDYTLDMSVRLHALRWSDKGYVFFNVNSCMANVDDFDYGDVIADTPAHIVVVSRRDSGGRGERKYVKIKWGEQRYLVEDHAVRGFCDYVAGLDSYNGMAVEAAFLMHAEDSERPTALLPTVPAEYAEHVRRPIDAKVTRVGRAYVEVNTENEWWDDLVTPVSLNAGSDHGLRRGMRLHALDSDEYNESVEITRTWRTRAEGIVVRTVRKRPGVPVNQWDDGRDATRRPISVGWRLTTSTHRRHLHQDELHAASEAGRAGH